MGIELPLHEEGSHKIQISIVPAGPAGTVPHYRLDSALYQRGRLVLSAAIALGLACHYQRYHPRTCPVLAAGSSGTDSGVLVPGATDAPLEIVVLNAGEYSVLV